MGLSLRPEPYLSRPLVSAPAVALWPFSFALSRDKVGFGSSTMAGDTPAITSSPIKVMAEEDTTGATYYTSGEPTSGGVVVVNRGAGGTTSTQAATTVAGATTRQKAADAFIQLGGNYEAVNNPVAGIVTNAQAIATSLGHSRFIHVPKHIDNADASGSLGWARLRQLTFDLRALYPGRVVDTELVFKKYSTGNSSDDQAQSVDQIPPSLAYTNAHANLAGNRVLADLAYNPWAHAMEPGALLPFIPYQRIRSIESTNQTNGGKVCVVNYDSSISGTLTGVTLAIVNDANFSIAIESGEIVIRRANGTFLTSGAYDLQLRATKGGIARDTWVQVYLCRANADGAYRVNINRNLLAREHPAFGGVAGTSLNVSALSIALGIKPLAGWDAESATTRQLMLLGGNRVDINVKATANLNLGVVFRNAAGTTVFSLDTSTLAAQRFNEANGIQWLFTGVDLTAGTYAQAVSDQTAQTSGATIVTGQTIELGRSGSGILNLLFSNGIGAGPTYTIGRSCLCEVVAVAMWPGLLNFGPITGGARDKVWDPATRRSILGQTRGGDAPGVVNGVSPCFWMEGEAGDFMAGRDRANPTQPWFATARQPMTSVAF